MEVAGVLGRKVKFKSASEELLVAFLARRSPCVPELVQTPPRVSLWLLLITNILQLGSNLVLTFLRLCFENPLLGDAAVKTTHGTKFLVTDMLSQSLPDPSPASGRILAGLTSFRDNFFHPKQPFQV